MPKRMRSRQIIGGLLSLGLLAGTALEVSPAQAANSNGPYYAEPAWDQKLPAATRFVVLTDWDGKAVLDRETGLVWEQTPQSTPHEWSRARSECVNRKTGNRFGWRLPSVNELMSLTDPSVPHPGPSLPPGHPFRLADTVGVTGNFDGVVSGTYWSASTDPDNPTSAWFVGLNFGGGAGPVSKTTSNHVWCVRGGMNADAY